MGGKGSWAGGEEGVEEDRGCSRQPLELEEEEATGKRRTAVIREQNRVSASTTPSLPGRGKVDVGEVVLGSPGAQKGPDHSLGPEEAPEDTGMDSHMAYELEEEEDEEEEEREEEEEGEEHFLKRTVQLAAIRCSN